MMERPATFSYLDRLVGEVAGAVCTTLSDCPALQRKRFAFLPVVTYKVKACLARAHRERRWTDQHLPGMANDIRRALVPVMEVFDLPDETIKNLSALTEKSALAALTRAI